ncbi:glycosyltransferase [Paracoccus pacificus]|uniref:Glycosyltransferase n=1 Tax=Paracoccus pacificus TaxID=1463598 RepID=A0ABW4RCN0_9RHOB
MSGPAESNRKADIQPQMPVVPVAVAPMRPRLARPTDRPVAATFGPRDQRPLGEILLEDGAVDPGNLLRAVMMRQRQNVRLGEILLAQGWVTEHALAHALSRQWRTSTVDLQATPPDTRLVDQVGADVCLSGGFVPWRRVGGVTFIATARPDEFAQIRARLPSGFSRLRMVLASERQIHESLLRQRQTALIRQAETRVPARESCRTRDERLTGGIAVTMMALAAAGLLISPVGVFAVLTAIATLSLILCMALKLMSFSAALSDRRERDRRAAGDADADAPGTKARPPQLPVISVMVPMFNESDVLEKLVTRLSRLTYPRELTDVLIVIEETDLVTRAALNGARLPHWIRTITVPDGPVRTKPRALNYALNFCRGTIIGVWDAEDRPEPEQLQKVAAGFAGAAPDVACLQGILDYYNPRTNWLARCFTMEYAAWFRSYLPGLARMGLVVPLGGTTLFFRRDALEKVGAWDAWNVTEDADLGVRLVRRGWRTEIIDTVTLEEANCRTLPWIKQRSRWLKGFVMTWGVHMRDPVGLWRDLGWRRFLGLQVQLFASVTQYLLTPVLWSFWVLSLGLPHPMQAPLAGLLGGYAVALMFTLFVASELLNMVVAAWATRGRAHRHLLPWVPTMHLYFPLGCLAGWKAIYEVVAKPFYWDKTEHGVYDEAESTEPTAPAPVMEALIPLRVPQGAMTGAVPDPALIAVPSGAGDEAAAVLPVAAMVPAPTLELRGSINTRR